MATDDTQAFWDWALQSYASKTLQALLLRAQDEHRLIVLELLLAGWLADTDRAYTAAQRQAVLSAAMPWETGVIRPLRAQRRAWRDIPEYSPLYERIQRQELAAERELAAIMVGALADIDATLPAHDPQGAALANLRPAIDEAPEAESLLREIAGLFSLR